MKYISKYTNADEYYSKKSKRSTEYNVSSVTSAGAVTYTEHGKTSIYDKTGKIDEIIDNN